MQLNKMMIDHMVIGWKQVLDEMVIVQSGHYANVALCTMIVDRDYQLYWT